MKIRIAVLSTLLAFSAVVSAQTTTSAPVWVTITQENSSLAVTLPAGATYRLGDNANNRWSQSVTVTQQTTLNPVSMGVANQFPFTDPDEGTVKELDVLETSAPQTVTSTNLAVTPNTSVAQIIPGLAAPASVPVAPGTSYTLTFSNFATSPTAGQNALMLALVNAPSTNANSTWEGTQMNLTIDGVTLVCTYGQTYTNGIFTLNCTVPATSASSSTGSSSSGSQD